MLYTSIDIGYHNLGLVQCDDQLNVLYSKRIDITRYRCPEGCKLYHTNEVADLISHFVQEYSGILDTADVILMERQPPGGLTNIETILFYIFRNKIKLISPNSVHAHFGYSHLNYEQRKERAVSIASKYMTILGMRKHDIADAFCMILYFSNCEKLNLKNKNKNKNMFEKKLFEDFRYGVSAKEISCGTDTSRDEKAYSQNTSGQQDQPQGP